MGKPLSTLAKRVKENIIKYRQISSGEKILAAVSGGVDSVGLLLILYELKDDLDFQVAAAHFDHCLRPTSAAEGDFVENLAKSLGLSFFRGAKDIYSLSKGDNLQEVARRERYGFLRNCARDWDAARIATAHHGDDQAETVLLHLLRGSGLEGLSAMSWVENDLIRPLLNISKAEIEGYCWELGQDFCLDESNLEDKYLRNRVRHHILPLLIQYNPQIMQALNTTADICREENKLLQMTAQKVYKEVESPSHTLKADKMSDMLPGLKRRVLRLAYESFAMQRGLFAGSLSYERTEAALNLKDGQKLSLPKGLWLYREGDELIFSNKLPERHNDSLSRSAPVELTEWQPLENEAWEYRAEVCADPGGLTDRGQTVALPLEWLPRLSFRTRRDGDVFAPARMEGHKKVKKIFQEAKIPHKKRDGWPLLLLDQEIIWIPCLRKAEIPSGKGQILLVSCRPFKGKNMDAT